MRAQLDRLGAAVAGVLCDHSFNILDGTQDGNDPFVHVEALTTPVNITDPADVEAYREVFRWLQAAAVTGEGARRLITEASRTL